jgi:hypothetical protein
VQARETLKKPKGIHSVSDAYKVLRKPVEKSEDIGKPKDIHSPGKSIMLPGEQNGPLFQSPILVPGTLKKAMDFVMKAKDNPAWKAAEKKIIEMVNRHKMEKSTDWENIAERYLEKTRGVPSGMGGSQPPGPPPIPGLKWNPQTHRWIKETQAGTMTKPSGKKEPVRWKDDSGKIVSVGKIPDWRIATLLHDNHIESDHSIWHAGVQAAHSGDKAGVHKHAVAMVKGGDESEPGDSDYKEVVGSYEKMFHIIAEGGNIND